jgi:hypothetical protein
MRAVAALGGVGRAIRARPVAARWLLAGPGALALALVTMMAMPLWLPAGRAGVDDIVYPIVLAPLIWALAFFYACLEENLVRGTLVTFGAVLLQGAAVLAGS